MSQSAAPEGASGAHRVVRSAVSAAAKLWQQLKRFHRPIATIAAFGAVLSGLLGYWSAYEAVEKVVVPKSASTEIARGGTPPLSVAIVTFAAVGTTADDQRTADKLARDVASIMGRHRWYKVIPPSLTSTYKGPLSDSRGIGREFDVRYVGQGELRHTAGNDILDVQLVDTTTGAISWSDRLEFHLPATTGETSADLRVSRRLSNAILDAEMRRAMQHPLPGSAWNLVLRGMALLTDSTKTQVQRLSAARTLWKEALRIEPNFVPALVVDAAGALAQLIQELNARDASKAALHLSEMDELSARAIAIDERDASAWSKRSDALAWQKRWDEAIAANVQALNLAPDSVTIVLRQANLALSMGHPAEALAIVKKAIALDPDANRPDTASMICHAALLSGGYDEASRACETSAGLGTDWWDQMLLLALYTQRGEGEKAALAKTTLLKLKPDITIANLKVFDPYNDARYNELIEQRVCSALRKAGIPEE